MARTLTTAQTAALAAPDRSTHVKVSVADADDVLVNVTDIEGIDFLDEARISANADDPIGQATVTLWREMDGVSLAPLMEASVANRDSTLQYAPFIFPGRRVEIHIATMMEGQRPDDDDWVLLWRGTVDDPAWGGDRSRLTFTARDDMAVLNDVVIEDVRFYGNDSPLEPIEDVMQDILDDQFGVSPAITLSIDGDPDFGIAEYEDGLAHVSVLAALEALADLQGWLLSVKWDATLSPADLAITYWEPNREGSDASGYTPDHTLGPDDYYSVEDIHLERAGVRNAGELVYQTADGAAAKVTDERSGSEDPQTRRFLRIVETGSPIRTAAQATAMLTAIMDDVSSPPAVQRINAAFWWPLELGDMVRYEANGVHYDEDQDWGTFGYTHVLRPNECRTIIEARGKPAGGFRRWLAKERNSRELPTILRTAVSYDGGTATVTAEANSITAELFYQEWTGAEWDSPVSFASAAAGTFEVTQSTSATKLYRVYGEDADDVAGEAQEVTIDRAINPTGTVVVDIDGSGVPWLTLSTPDDDVTIAYWDAAEDAFPEVTTADASQAVASFGTAINVTDDADVDALAYDETVYVTVRFARGAILGPAVNVSATRSSAVRIPTGGIDATLSADALSCVVTVNDPDLRVTAVEFQAKSDSGDYGGTWVSTWDSSTGTAGTDAALSRTEAVTRIGKHVTGLKVRVTYTDDAAASQFIYWSKEADPKRIAEVTDLAGHVNTSSAVVVDAVGDKDTANIYVTVGDGTTPADPTNSVNDGSIAGRSGTVTTAITATDGNTVTIKAIGYDSAGVAGPVQTKTFLAYRRMSVPEGIQISRGSQNLLGPGAGDEESSTAAAWKEMTVTLAETDLDVGDTVSFSGELDRGVNADQIRLELQFIQADGSTVVSTHTSSNVSTAAYERLEIPELEIPALTASVKVYAENPTLNGQPMKARRFMLVEGPVAVKFQAPPIRPDRETQDELPDGTTYKRVLATELDTNRVKQVYDTVQARTIAGSDVFDATNDDATRLLYADATTVEALKPAEVGAEKNPGQLTTASVSVVEATTDDQYTVTWGFTDAVTSTWDVEIDCYREGVLVESATGVTATDGSKVILDAGAADGIPDDHHAVVRLYDNSGALIQTITTSTVVGGA